MFFMTTLPAFLARVNPTSTKVNPACMRKIKKEAIRVHTMSMEAACSDRALMGFPTPSAPNAQPPLGSQRDKKRIKRTRVLPCIKKFTLFLTFHDR
jgi:hypothetical protein